MPNWMAFNPADYTSNTLHLTTRQHGGYILLICAAWSARGHLPGTDAALMAITKLGKREWVEDGPVLKTFLTSTADGWMHERVAFEWQDAQALIDAKSKAGKKGARNRWHGRGTGNAMALPCDSQKQTDNPQQLPLPNSVAKATGAAAPPEDPVKALFDDGVKILGDAGTPERQARSQIGKWRKNHGDDATRTAIQTAADMGISEPVAWIEASLNRPKETYDQRRIREGLEVIMAYEAKNDRH